MIYSLLQDHLQNILLEKEEEPKQLILKSINNTTIQDALGMKYQIDNTDVLTTQQITVNYNFEYEFDFTTNSISKLECIIHNIDGDNFTIKINLLTQVQPQHNSNLIKKAILKAKINPPKLQPHELYYADRQSEISHAKAISTLGIQSVQPKVEFNTSGVKEPKPQRVQKQKKEPKLKIVKEEKASKPKITKPKAQHIKILKPKQESTHQEDVQEFQQIEHIEQIMIPKQTAKRLKIKVKADDGLAKLVAKLDIPKNWKDVAAEYSKTQRIWDMKYYEKLVLLSNSISKRHLFNVVSKLPMDEEVGRQFAKFTCPPGLREEQIIKRRKIYSRNVVCSLFE